MDAGKSPPGTIDEYIAQFPEEIRKILQELREVIGQEAPDAEEAIRYRIPTFTLKGNLVHFAAFRDHISFFPTPSAIDAFGKELSSYETSRGTVRFPLGEPIPFDLVRKIVRFRVRENLERKAGKGHPR